MEFAQYGWAWPSLSVSTKGDTVLVVHFIRGAEPFQGLYIVTPVAR